METLGITERWWETTRSCSLSGNAGEREVGVCTGAQTCGGQRSWKQCYPAGERQRDRPTCVQTCASQSGEVLWGFNSSPSFIPFSKWRTDYITSVNVHCLHKACRLRLVLVSLPWGNVVIFSGWLKFRFWYSKPSKKPSDKLEFFLLQNQMFYNKKLKSTFIHGRKAAKLSHKLLIFSKHYKNHLRMHWHYFYIHDHY